MTVPQAVAELNDETFADCTALASVEFADDSRLARIGVKTFAGSGLETFVAPTTLRALGYEAFRGCAKLKTAELGAELAEIGTSCFARSGLERVGLPARIRQFDRTIFDGCASLKTVSLAEGAENIVADWLSCGSVEEAHLQELASNAFCRCKQLK